MQAGGFFTGNGRKTKEGAPLDIKDTLNELLVKLFRNINTIEEQAIRTEEYRDMTTNDMHVIEAIGTGAAKNMTSVAKTLAVTTGTLTISVNAGEPGGIFPGDSVREEIGKEFRKQENELRYARLAAGTADLGYANI